MSDILIHETRGDHKIIAKADSNDKTLTVRLEEADMSGRVLVETSYNIDVDSIEEVVEIINLMWSMFYRGQQV